MTKGSGGGTHRFGSDNWIQVVQFVEDTRVALIKECIDGLLDDADRVIWPPVEVGADLGKDVLSDIVEGMAGQDICAARQH